MRQIRDRMREKCPRVHKIISTTSYHAFNVGYWGVITLILYGYMLQYNVRHRHDSINK